MRTGLHPRSLENLPTNTGNLDPISEGRAVAMTPAQEARHLRNRIEAITSEGALSEYGIQAVNAMKQRFEILNNTSLIGDYPQELGETDEKLELSTLPPNFGKKLKALLETQNNPDMEKLQGGLFPTKFDFRDIEKHGFTPGIKRVIIDDISITRENFISIKGIFQLQRFHYAKMLWDGSEEFDIHGCRSIVALKAMIESNTLYQKICNTTLIGDAELEEMLEIIKDKEGEYPDANGSFNDLTLEIMRQKVLARHKDFM